MMEAGELAETVALILGFHAPALVSVGDDVLREGGRAPAGEGEARGIWMALVRSEGTLQMVEAVRAVAETPSEETLDPLRTQLAELFVENPALARQIETLVAQGSYALLVEQAAQDSFVAPVMNSLRELTRLRRVFTFLFVGVGLLSAGAVGILGTSFAGVGLFLVVQALRAGITWYYGQRLRLPGAGWLALAALIPGSLWPVFFTMRSWRPMSLSVPAPGGGRLEPWVKDWMSIYASLPLLALIFLLTTSAPDLVQRLGGLHGAILFIFWLAFYVPGILGLRSWYWQGRGDDGWQFGLVTALLGASNLFGLLVLFVVGLINLPG
jgi:hypothetical protein